MHGTHSFHSIFSLLMYVSIVDLALFCLDLPLPKRLSGRQAQKSTHASGIPLGKKVKTKRCPPDRTGSLPPASHRTPAFLSGRDLVSDDRLLFFNPVQFVMHPQTKTRKLSTKQIIMKHSNPYYSYCPKNKLIRFDFLSDSSSTKVNPYSNTIDKCALQLCQLYICPPSTYTP